MAALKETTYIERNTYNEIGFFKGIVWGLVFAVPYWIIMITLFIWLFN